MGKVAKIFRSEFVEGYSLFERLFMIGMILLQIAVFAAAPDSILSFIVGISGVVCVVLTAKGKISSYAFGLIQVLGYMYLAWHQRFYGEVLENVFYLATTIWGIFIWKNHMVKNTDGTSHVRTKAMNGLQWVLSIIITIAATLALGFGLNKIGSQQAYTDAATNIFAIFGQLLLVHRYREQWIWWLLVDLFCIKLWYVAGNWSMVAMYVGWTINCLYGWYNWTKLAENSHQI